MSIKAMAAVVIAVAITVFAAKDVQPSDAVQNPWSPTAVQVNEALPPWHPPIPDARLPQGHPPVEETFPALPPGHPPIPRAQPRCPGRGTQERGFEGGHGFVRDERKIIST